MNANNTTSTHTFRGTLLLTGARSTIPRRAIITMHTLPTTEPLGLLSPRAVTLEDTPTTRYRSIIASKDMLRTGASSIAMAKGRSFGGEVPLPDDVELGGGWLL